MTINITKRDLKVYSFGIFTCLFLSLIFNWNDARDGFSKGWNAYDKKVTVDK